MPTRARCLPAGCRHLFAGLPRDVWPCADQAADPALRALSDRLVAVLRRVLDGLSEKTLVPSPEAACEIVSDIRNSLPTGEAGFPPSAGRLRS